MKNDWTTIDGEGVTYLGGALAANKSITQEEALESAA